MAKSRLVIAGKQLRFLSKYFLKPAEQELIHGAEIFVGFMEDEEMVHQIEEKNLAREFFTVPFVKRSFDKLFNEDAETIFTAFIKMLLFDAWVGNNDRHFYNWGVVRHLESKHKPYFTPVYDTARGLFWNIPEKKVIDLHRNPKNLAIFLNKYSKNSKPKTGIEGNPNVNHFQLLQYIYENQIGITQEEVKSFINTETLDVFLNTINKEFGSLLSKERRWLICECLNFRFNQIVPLLK